MPISISAPTRCLHSNLKTAIELSMSLHVDGVQFDLRNEVKANDFGDSASRHLVHLLNERGREVGSAWFPLRGDLIDSDRIDQRIHAIHRAIELAARLKTKLMILRPGTLPPEETPERETFSSVWSELVAQGHRHGVMLCLQSSRDTIEALKTFQQSARNPGFTFDVLFPAWAGLKTGSQTVLRELHPSIGHLEAVDVIRGTTGIYSEVPIGDGRIDWDEVAALLHEMNFKGWMNLHETRPSTAISEYETSIEFIRNRFI